MSFIFLPVNILSALDGTTLVIRGPMKGKTKNRNVSVLERFKTKGTQSVLVLNLSVSCSGTVVLVIRGGIFDFETHICHSIFLMSFTQLAPFVVEPGDEVTVFKTVLPESSLKIVGPPCSAFKAIAVTTGGLKFTEPQTFTQLFLLAIVVTHVGSVSLVQICKIIFLTFNMSQWALQPIIGTVSAPAQGEHVF